MLLSILLSAKAGFEAGWKTSEIPEATALPPCAVINGLFDILQKVKFELPD